VCVVVVYRVEIDDARKVQLLMKQGYRSREPVTPKSGR
jgi:hypothetical protein